MEEEYRRAATARHKENKARLAEEYHRVQSIGAGFFEYEQMLEFHITFIEEPTIAYGAQLDLDELGELLATEPGETPPLPILSGMVTNWDQDDRGFYTGAWVGVRVFFPDVAVPTEEFTLSVQHHFTFTAIGIKDVPVDARD